jgi:PAB1-binding protein PBP1
LALIQEVEKEIMLPFDENNREFIRNVALENPDLYLDESDVYALVKKTFKSSIASTKAYTASAKRNVLVTAIQTSFPVTPPTLSHTTGVMIGTPHPFRSDDNTRRIAHLEHDFKLRKKEYEETIVEMEIKISELSQKSDLLEHERSMIQKQLMESNVKEKTYCDEIQKVTMCILMNL